MNQKTITSRITNRFGVQEEIAKHKAEATETWPYPELVGCQTGSPADDDTEFLTVASTWKEGPPPPAPEPEV